MAAEELKIPVFTVLKNGATLKNVFIVNNPPPLDQDGDDEGQEEILVVGRHPDCNIVLTHPSISRFHVQIYSNPSAQKLCVMDLSSVHGTWVSDKKIEPGERVELIEGDFLRVGGSTRVYRLHWVPVSQAYDLEQSSVLASASVEVKQEESTAAGEEKAVETYEDNDTPDVEFEELGKFNDPSHKREEEHSPSGEGDVVGAAEDGGLPRIVEFEEVEESIDPLSEIEKENITNAKGKVVEFQDEGLLNTDSENFGKFEDPSSWEESMEIYQDMLTEDQESHSLDLILGEMGSLAFTESSGLPANYETATGLAMFENRGSSTIEEHEASLSPSEIHPNQIHSSNTCQLLGSNSIRLSLPMQDETKDEDTGRQRSEKAVLESSVVTETLEIVQSRCSSGKENEGKESLSHISALSLLESAPSSLEGILAENGSTQKLVEENLILPQLLYAKPDLPSENSNTQNSVRIHQLEQKDSLNLDLANLATEPSNSGLFEHNILSEVTCQYVKEIQPARSPLGRESQSEEENLESPPIKVSTKSNPCSIWSRRGKPATFLRLQTGSSRGKSRPAALNSENGQKCKESVEDEVINRNLFSGSDGEEEIFTPDKENMTPNTRKLKFMKEIGKVGVLHSRPLKRSSSIVSSGPKICLNKDVSECSDQENQTPMKNFTPNTLLHKSAKASKVLSSPISHPDEDIFHSSDKENQTPKFQKEQRVKPTSRMRSRLVKEISGVKGRERMPFQSLRINSEIESHSSGPGALTSGGSETGKKTVSGFISNNSNGERKKSWIMVADTNSFLDNESRKSLQLLEGLRGTQLVIPRIVLRDLDSLKRQRSLFRRSTGVSSVLEWIEETMVNSKWWIQIQSSAEEGWAVAPTPRACPYSLNEASDNFPMFTASAARFSLSGNPSVEIISPTAEDRILEYALLVRKRNCNGQLVLLSNDTSLKIKAMAEGLLCENPQEFRESLINPFSERFMWAESSPRGQTWSLSDDDVLKEKYFRHPFKKPSRGDDAKGLKLILRHNSQYGQMKSVS
ncbi:hypothetical protein CDL15_Pgr028344 [Punica granatum]|uniref:FHA domain-containing protein n=1 Tax=Punica granatum TaxID=22663 RepID=A0A218W5H8_PUNGR|nr:hypothetical protein CDL15_Pgr028344 [Punica granatum]